MSRYTVRAAAWLLVPALVIAGIWLPLLRLYHVRDVRISPAVVEQGRADPPQEVLLEIRGERLLPHGWATDAQLISAAEDLLRGELRFAGQPTATVRLPFHPDNLTAPALSLTRLFVAGLAPADLLLQAYERTGEERFFSASQAVILAFGRYEATARLPKGFLWEEHATANRVYVLSDFWALYRQRADFDPAVAAAVLRLAARSGAVLAGPQHFIYATNHGVMQNIALLRLRLAFPFLPNADGYAAVAMQRLAQQLPFYVSPEGVILEHSAGYQFFGLELLKQMFRYAQMLSLSVPEEWTARYALARAYADQLRRPDGTVPVYGDTNWASRWPAYDAGRPGRATGWYPISGYAVWWDGLDRWPESRQLRQTVTTFSYYPGHAHKHADDLSVLLWAGGQAWWSNVGYWPYDAAERAYVESWKGSNAPHLVDEPAVSERVPRLLSRGSSATAVALDALREGPGGYHARRQVVHVRPDTWLILDVTDGVPGGTSLTRWSTDYGVDLRPGDADRCYILTAKRGAAQIVSQFFGSPSMTHRLIPKALGAFRARTAQETEEQTVRAVDVTQSSDGAWTAAVWRFETADPASTCGAAPSMTAWGGPEQWLVSLPGAHTPMQIAREGHRLTVRQGANADSLILSAVDVRSERSAIRAAFHRAEGAYPAFPLRLRYRQWASYGLIAIAVMQELTLALVAERRRRAYGLLRLATLALWITGGVLLSMVLGW